MDTKQKLLEFFRFTEIFNFEISERNNKIFIQKHPISFVLEKIENDKYYFYTYFKTSSWFIDGDRTDIHELLPILISVYTRSIENINFSIVNQANEFSAESEISYAYIVPTQPHNAVYNLDTPASFENFKSLFMSFIYCVIHLHDLLPIECQNQFEKNYEDKDIVDWFQNINKIFKVNDNSAHIQYIKRSNPSYFYYRNSKAGISIVKSAAITKNLLHTINSTYKYKSLEGINCILLINEYIKNVVFYNRLNKVKKILKILDNVRSNNIIPFDNFCILLGKEHFIIFTNYGNLYSFLEEKDKIRKRYLNETFNLFHELPIKWTTHTLIDTQLFEDLVLELLEREHGILTVKKVAPTNQADNGRDLIANYTDQFINPYVNITNIDNKIHAKKLIVQCKTRFFNSKNQTIGKKDVDIANTLLDYEPNGYLLVTNTQISRDLTEYLEKLEQRNQYDIQWWNKFDIEKRLREHPDIMNKYKRIVSFQQTDDDIPVTQSN